jgi:subtilisin family serine protease
VAASNEYGLLDPMSNFGPSIGSKGLMGPGINITSALSGGGYLQMSGTSFADPFVTGALALLWSVLLMASAAQLIHSVRIGTSDGRHFR